MPWICNEHFTWPTFSTPSSQNLHLWFVLIPDFILLFYGKMTEFLWGYLSHVEVKRNTFKKNASLWFPGHLEDKWHLKQCTRCTCTKIKVTWDDSLLDLELVPAQSLLRAGKPLQWRRAISVQRVFAKQLELDRAETPRLIPRFGTNPSSAWGERKSHPVH